MQSAMLIVRCEHQKGSRAEYKLGVCDGQPSCWSPTLSQLVVCTPDTPLIDAVSLLVREHVHHLFVVDAVAGRPLACVGMTDMLRLALVPPA